MGVPTVDVFLEEFLRPLWGTQHFVHGEHVFLVTVVDPNGALGPRTQLPWNNRLNQQVRNSHQVRILAHAIGINQEVSLQNDPVCRPRQFEAAPFGTQNDGVPLDIGHGHVDYGQFWFGHR
jgi:hypothetical protein